MCRLTPAGALLEVIVKNQTPLKTLKLNLMKREIISGIDPVLLSTALSRLETVVLGMGGGFGWKTFGWSQDLLADIFQQVGHRQLGIV